MARISIADSFEKIPNAFALCVLAAKRARQLAGGSNPLVQCDNKAAVTSLREIAAGKVGSYESVDAVIALHVAEQKSLENDRTGSGETWLQRQNR